MPHSVTSILAQIRSLHAQMPQAMLRPAAIDSAGLPSNIGSLRAPGSLQTAKIPSFTHTLKAAMEGVNAAQQHASTLASGFERGEPGTDLSQVMVAAQQAHVAFRATVEVRNRLVQAYQDVLGMPL